MIQILVFLLLSVMYLASVAGAAFMFHVSTQPGQWLGHWQIVLRRWDLAGRVFLFKIGGGCALCFSHAVAHLSFFPYLVICLSTGLWPFSICVSLLWYGVYIALSTNLTLYFITKLYRK